MVDDARFALDALADMWKKRGATDPGWFKECYEMVAKQIVVHRPVGMPSYWEGPKDYRVYTPSAEAGKVLYDDGSYDMPAEARERAFALLVFADLAEHAS